MTFESEFDETTNIYWNDPEQLMWGAYPFDITDEMIERLKKGEMITWGIAEYVIQITYKSKDSEQDI